MKKIIHISFAIVTAAFMTGISVCTVFAATQIISGSGLQRLKNKINAEEARVAELKVQLNPKLGINHTLGRKWTGDAVRLLQQFLKTYGVYPDGLITGYFGVLTEGAVKEFQKKESIDPVGIVGPKTRARIIEISRRKVAGNQVAAPEIIAADLTTDVTESGSAVASTTSFASTTQNIYAVLSLKNAAQNTKVAYIRYHKDMYVDSEVSHPSRNGLTYFHFQWSLKPDRSRTIGNYSLVFYIDGKKSKTVQYAIY